MIVAMLAVVGCSSDTISDNGDDTFLDEPTATGDPDRGRQIWVEGYDDAAPIWCSYCHSLDGSEGPDGSEVPFANRRAPSWLGISERAADRVPGLTAEEYLRQSIWEPSAFVVEGYDNVMFNFSGGKMTEEDVDDLIAFLLTQ
jgi:hypothetical protein